MALSSSQQGAMTRHLPGPHGAYSFPGGPASIRHEVVLNILFSAAAPFVIEVSLRASLPLRDGFNGWRATLIASCLRPLACPTSATPMGLTWSKGPYCNPREPNPAINPARTQSDLIGQRVWKL